MKRNFLKEISFLLFVLLVLCVNFFAHCQNQVINLNSNWTIANKNRSVLVNSVELPATIHSVLINKKLISNPLTSFNASDNYKWIDEEEWLFENIFWINESTSMRNSFYELELNSIDTIAKVYLNDFFILFAQNQFVKYSIRNLNSKLREGSNRLLIEFKSPVKHSSVLSNLHPYDIPQKCVNKRRYNLECHINFIRKQQFSLGSEWAPYLPTIGIDGDVNLLVFKSIDFSISVNTFLKNKEELLNGSETWILQVSINVKNIHVVNGLNFTFRVDELNLTQNEYLTSYAKEILIHISNKNNINYWYPSGYGKQTQYKLKVICKSENIELVKEKKIAFRKVKLIESDLNQQTGKSFYFEINDIPIFLKGANWMPNLLFSDQFNSEREKVLFDAVKFANINCLRVVGYESDSFFEKTDELGILVMQIFMFDSAYYPVNSDFVENVMEELIQQLRRLRQHSSIIAWIGNNKIEQAMYENWFNLTDSELYINDYIKLFVHHFGRQISEHDKSNRAYLSSSPSNGANKSYELNPNSVSHGDFHIEYESNFWDWENFKLARCLTQFGTKSYPSFLVLKKSSDLSKLIKSIETNENEIAKSIQTNMRLPVNLESGDMLEYVIYLSQIDQAMSLKEGIEYYRRSNYDPFTSMGFFSKQLNDVSIGPSSTATVDFDLNYKIGHYFIKNSFSKYLLSASIDKSSRSLRFYFVSDSLNNVTGRALIKFFSLEKLASTKYEASLSINANRQSVQHIGQLTFDEIKTRSGCEFNSTENSCVIILEYALDGSDEKSSQNFFLMNRNLKEMKIRKIPTIRVEKVNRVNEKTFSIDINTDEPALFVWLEVPNGIFSPNGFHLVEARKTVQLELENSSQISDKELMELIRIKSLMNAYGYPISISKTNNGMMLGSFNFFLFFSIVFALYWVQIV